MINVKDRYYITIAFRGTDGSARPSVGDIVQANGFLFSVKLSSSRWVALIGAIKNKVEYYDCLKSFKQDTPIVAEDWYPTSVFEDNKETLVYNKYEGNIVFIGNKEIISSLP
jgi:hypothetical protein